MRTTDPLPSNRVAAVTAAVGVVVFLVTTWAAHLPEVMVWDFETIAAFAGMGGDAAVTLSREVTAIGNGLVAVLVGVVVAVLLFSAGFRTAPLWIVIAVPGSIVVNHGLKLLIGRPRPEVVEWLTYAGANAYPSGHSLYGVAAYGVIALAVLPMLHSWRWLVVAGWIMLALALGATRVHLGVHHPTDVLGGFAAGLAWLGLSLLLTRALYRPELRVRRDGGLR